MWKVIWYVFLEDEKGRAKGTRKLKRRSRWYYMKEELGGLDIRKAEEPKCEYRRNTEAI